MPIIRIGPKSQDASETGLTLIELLLASTILAGMAVIFTLLMSSGLDLWEAGTAGSRVDDEVRSVVERMGREVRASRKGAGQIAIGGGNTSITFPLDTDNDGAYETTVRYYLDGAVLRRQDNGLPAVGNPMLEDVTAVVFRDPFSNSDLITISVAVTKVVEGEKGVASVAMRTGAGPRND
jgi:hypothetical protein